MNIMWFSSGVSSFIAAYFCRGELDAIIYTHIEDQHPDSLRFNADCELELGGKITQLQSQYYINVEDVCLRRNFINSPHGAQCTVKLKKEVRKRWEYEHPGKHTYFWGLDYSEREKLRAERIVDSMPVFEHRFPLIEQGLIKEDAHALCKRLGIKRPAMYDLGYHNNNCIACIKGGKGYFNKIRRDFPDAFAARAKMERKIGASCIKGCFLDELDPDAGRHDPPITEDCGIMCELNLLKEE